MAVVWVGRSPRVPRSAGCRRANPPRWQAYCCREIVNRFSKVDSAMLPIGNRELNGREGTPADLATQVSRPTLWFPCAAPPSPDARNPTYACTHNRVIESHHEGAGQKSRRLVYPLWRIAQEETKQPQGPTTSAARLPQRVTGGSDGTIPTSIRCSTISNQAPNYS